MGRISVSWEGGETLLYGCVLIGATPLWVLSSYTKVSKPTVGACFEAGQTSQSQCLGIN